jgi:hypothetical protein
LAKAKGGTKPHAAADVIKELSAAARGRQKVRIAPKSAGSHETIMYSQGKPILTVSKPRRGEGVSVTLIPDGHGDRGEVLAAFQKLLEVYWPKA